jgi:hypothetical protein
MRLGMWLEPDHQMRATIDDPLIKALLRRGNVDIHYSPGLGFTTQRYQIDFAADFADRTRTLSLSTIFNF